MSKSVCYFDSNLTELRKSDAIKICKNNFSVDRNPAELKEPTETTCIFTNVDEPTERNRVLGLSDGVGKENDQILIENISESVTETDEKDERKREIRRKRSSSLSSLALLKQTLQLITVDDKYEQKLRRVSSVPGTCNSGETQLEDGLLTTTFCSTEL